ncbi:MAG: glycosyltransferase 87 family protein [Bacteroidota bacterium]
MWIVRQKEKTAPQQFLYYWLAFAVLLRILLVGAFPALSDDIYRFIWDGRLWLAGHNPFDYLPTWYLEESHQVPGLTKDLFDQLNSPKYYTIYPPVAQFTFVVSCWIAPNSWVGAAIVMKLLLLAAELGSLWLILRLLAHWKLPATRVLWFALNPLLIVEVMGNLHFEGVMIFFLLLGIWYLTKEAWWRSATAMALAVASKLLPLMFFPFLIRRLGWQRSFAYFSLVGVVLVGLWLPMLSETFVTNFGSSVELYFQRFEFNASFFNIVQWVGYQYEGYNLIRFIGPSLALLVLGLILWRSWHDQGEKWIQLPGLWLFAISVYLFCATTVHPWYTALPLVLCIFTNYRWPILWSFLITFTYITYWNPENFQEQLWVVAVEYLLVVGFAFWEVRGSKIKKAMA